MKGQLPKAYLRLDPNADQHPDRDGLLLLMCSANRQHPRGRFHRQTVVDLLGRRRAAAWMTARPGRSRPELIELPDGTFYLDGWDELQEGDWTVSERMRRLRDHRNAAVTTTVTPPLLERIPDRHPPSEASGVKASGTDSQPGSQGAREAEDEPPPTPATPDQAAAKALARLGPPGESEQLRREIYAELPACSAATRMPQDVLLAKYSRTPSGGVITNVENCLSVPWLRTTLERLRGARLAAAGDAAQAAGPAPRGRPTVADVSRSVFGIDKLGGERKP